MLVGAGHVTRNVGCVTSISTEGRGRSLGSRAVSIQRLIVNKLNSITSRSHTYCTCIIQLTLTTTVFMLIKWKI